MRILPTRAVPLQLSPHPLRWLTGSHAQYPLALAKFPPLGEIERRRAGLGCAWGARSARAELEQNCAFDGAYAALEEQRPEWSAVRASIRTLATAIVDLRYPSVAKKALKRLGPHLRSLDDL